MNASGWFRTPHAIEDPRARLVCFPHAGGAASSFHTWGRRLEDVEVLAVQYPGRQDRLDEPPAERMDELVAPIAAALRADGDRPLALLGHSMGAAVAHEVARALERDGHEVAHLFVSGRPAPGTREPVRVHERGDDALLEDARRLSGSEGALADPAMRELALPSLRADYRLIETYEPPSSGPLAAPITACIGDRDPEVTREEALRWEEQTDGAFAMRVFAGDHFYLFGAEAELAETVGTALPERATWPSTP